MTSIATNLQVGQNSATSGQFTPVQVSSADGSTFQEDRDSYVPHSGEGTQATEESRPSFFTRFVQGIVNTARNAWRFIRQYNPITLLFNQIEQRTISGLLQNAQNRNDATTQTELENYHRSIEYNPDSPNENAIFRFQRSTRCNGHLVVVSLGHGHDFNTPTSIAGIHGLTQRFLDAGYDVLTVRAGTVSHELWNRFGAASPLHPQIVETHVGNLIEDAYRRVGIFRDCNYQDMSAVCYSMGAGSLHNNSGRLQNMPIRGIVYIDPAHHRAHELGCGITERPELPGSFCWYGQGNSYFINGSFPSGLRPGDMAVQIQEADICHSTIDNHPEVLNGAFNFINNRSVRRN